MNDIRKAITYKTIVTCIESPIYLTNMHNGKYYCNKTQIKKSSLYMCGDRQLEGICSCGVS